MAQILKKFFQNIFFIFREICGTLVCVLSIMTSFKDNNASTQEVYSLREGNTWRYIRERANKKGLELLEELKKENINTFPKLFDYSVHKYQHGECLGTRKLLRRDIKIEKGKEIEKLSLGDYEWKTFAESGKTMQNIAKGFCSMGFKKGDKIAILSETREEWLLTAIAALRIGMTVVTIYTNLSNTGVTHAIYETEVETVIASCETIPRIMSILSECPNIMRIIVFEDPINGIGNVSSKDVNIIPFSNFPASEESLPDYPTTDDLAVIMYTSGSTGTPKGVELTHDNIFATLECFFTNTDMRSDEIFLAYLPLAHILELAGEVCNIATGSKIAYSSPFTLTSNSPKISTGTVGDIVLAKPTVMAAVPLILDRIVNGVYQKVSKTSPFKQQLFHWALRKKIEDENSLWSQIFDAVIFKKVRAELGGSLKMLGVGGAPLNPNTHMAIRALLGCTIRAGFGCTETTASATGCDENDRRTGHVGLPNFNNLLSLIDWEEGGYYVTDKPRPRGEIVIGGRTVCKKYYKNEEETKSVFFQENGVNWFKTGDIGEIDDSGVLYIIDRKKNLAKLKTGEYVSLGGIEATLKTYPFIENICMFAYPTQEYTVAIVNPNENLLESLQANGVGPYRTIELACSDKKVEDYVCKELQSVGIKNGLTKWDIPKRIHLDPVIWTPESGFITASMKIRRKKVEEAFKEKINELYNI